MVHYKTVKVNLNNPNSAHFNLFCHKFLLNNSEVLSDDCVIIDSSEDSVTKTMTSVMVDKKEPESRCANEKLRYVNLGANHGC